jgi:hypothetical protein
VWDADGMWVQHSMWIVQDDGLEVGVADSWDTRVEAWLGDAEEVPTSTPLGLSLANDPMTTDGPIYVGVGRMLQVEPIGHFLDTGSVQVAPISLSQHGVGATVRFRSLLYARPCLFSNPPDPLIKRWTVRQILVRQWESVPDVDPNSYRVDPSTVRFRAIERMRMWEDEVDPTTGQRVASDYLLDLE